MIPPHIREHAMAENARFDSQPRELFVTPVYQPDTYVTDLIQHRYFDALIVLRHFVQAISHYYFASERSAKNVDLFMLTPSVSSPMGPGSDSEPIAVSFGGLQTHLVDSAQFGFEPLLLQSPGMVYCYLPSMRGENPDPRHLNQFYHCESEMTGYLEDIIPVVEGYVRRLCEMLGVLAPTVLAVSDAPEASLATLAAVAWTERFPRIAFDDAVELLIRHSDATTLVRTTSYGRDLTSAGELALMDTLGCRTPLWITHYDRDRVPFYQKPVAGRPNKVENADLIFPPLRPEAFGGEVVGCGQRQDNAEEMLESMRRQEDIPVEPYRWYMDLRFHPAYRTTSGFGLGIERFLAWALAKSNIRDVSLYPRLKGVRTYP